MCLYTPHSLGVKFFAGFLLAPQNTYSCQRLCTTLGAFERMGKSAGAAIGVSNCSSLGGAAQTKRMADLAAMRRSVLERRMNAALFMCAPRFTPSYMSPNSCRLYSTCDNSRSISCQSRLTVACQLPPLWDVLSLSCMMMLTMSWALTLVTPSGSFEIRFSSLSSAQRLPRLLYALSKH